jgi:hypothetical protein
MKLIGTCKACKVTRKIDASTLDAAAQKWARDRGYASIQCCGRSVLLTRIKGATTSHVCAAKCLNSRSHVCECSCGGANHGRSYERADARDLEREACLAWAGRSLGAWALEMAGGAPELRPAAMGVIMASFRAAR